MKKKKSKSHNYCILQLSFKVFFTQFGASSRGHTVENSEKSFLEINVIQDKTGKLLTIKTNIFFTQTLYNVQFSKSQL